MAATISSAMPTGQIDPVLDEETEDQFRKMAADHRSGKRRFGLYGAILLGIGFILFLLGALTSLPTFWLVAIGIITMAVSAFAFDQAFEHRERLDGLQVLREEWIQMRRQAPDDAELDPRFTRFLTSLYS